MRDQTRQPADAVRLAAEAMRTRFELVLWGPSERDVRAAGEEALAIIHETEDRLSPFRPGSLVSAISRDGASRPVRLDADTFRLLSLCADVAQRSFHAFDITLWPLMHAWGLRGEPPSPDAPAGCVWGWQRLVLDAAARTAHTNDPGVRLDLGAVGKGHALDLAARAIAESGVVTAAFLHAGTSTAIAVGTPAHPFAVRLAAADATRSPTVRLTQGALSVSAPRGGHIIDPESGRPVRPGLELAATLAPGAAEADAWSTALLVLSSRPDGLAGFTPPPDLTTITLQPRGGWIAQGPRRRDVSIPGAPGSADAPAVAFSPAPSPTGQTPCPSATPGAPS
ncbi:MAG: FAD:protein FMN transferase [Phycisphaeraceae bacterium]|nr:FAD:protein FMN transferase [Phycisphaeraceae bacterium]